MPARYQRYFLEVAYQGTHYHGWQKQINQRTIQESLENAFARIFQRTIEVVGSGRTDTGVHAHGQVAHVDLPVSNPKKLCYQLNAVLPDDIVVNTLWPVAADAHARFSATARTYQYYLATHPSPFLCHTTLYYPYPLDIEAMNQAAQVLLGRHDFTSFCKKQSEPGSYDCTVTQLGWHELTGFCIFSITADRFLHHMVRTLVGTFLDIGRHKKNGNDLLNILQARDRCAAGQTVAARGLFLTRVTYDNDE